MFMQTVHQDQSTNFKITLYCIAFLASLIYVFISFVGSETNNDFNFSATQLLLLRITIILPYIATWFFAAYGLSVLNKYIIEAKPEDLTIISLLRSFKNGLLWITLGTIFATLINGMDSYFADSADVLQFITIVTNYLYVFPALIGFILIYRGMRNLRLSPEISGHSHRGYLLTTFIIILISSFYFFLIYTNPTRQFSADPSIQPTYYLPDIFILLTIICPIIITWWLGFYAAFTMSDLLPYFTDTEIYRGITRILYGIWSIIFTSIILQALLSLGEERLFAIGLGLLLLIIYIFFFLQAFGYFLIALGSNNLQKTLKENALV
jgi:hypothetical protein